MIEEDARQFVEYEPGEAVRAHAVDGKLLARLVAGVFEGDPSTGRFLVSLGDYQAEQTVEKPGWRPLLT